MRPPAQQLVIMICSLALLCSCSKINLQGGKSGQPGNQSVGGNQPAGNLNASVPPLDGEWELDYEYKDKAYVGNGVLSQQGSAITGSGADQTGREWQLEGQVQGTQVSFQKKYADSAAAIVYTGELKYLESPDYTGWAMEGTYNSNGASGKWVANPTSPLQAPQAQAPVQAPFQFNPIPTNTQGSGSQTQHDNLGDVKPLDISGKYEVSYQYNFKKISSKMWLRNDGKKITGDGVDIIDKTSERFTIPKGWYDYPKVTIHRQYTKGAGAKETRSVIFKATLSSNGRDISMKGETQHGGQWSARLVR